jgi:simple sugar transport system permease protein
MTIRLEQRMTIPRWLSPVTTIGAVVVALLISAVILAFVGGDPIRAYGHIVEAAFGSVGVLSDTLVKATPLILTGLACSLAFRMRLWNIGAEGQFLLGAWGASAIVLAPLLPPGTPGIVLIPAMMIAGALAGAAWGFIPGVLRARLGVNEIITSLMLNYVAANLATYLIFGSRSYWRSLEGSGATFPQGKVLPAKASWPAFDLGSLVVPFGFLVGAIVAA